MRKKSTYDQDSGLVSRTEREFGQKKKPNLWDFTEIGRLYFFFLKRLDGVLDFFLYLTFQILPALPVKREQQTEERMFVPAFR